MIKLKDLEKYEYDSIFWDEVSLPKVIEYFVEGYKLKDKKKDIQGFEFFIDTSKDKVIIKNYIYKLKNLGEN